MQNSNSADHTRSMAVLLFPAFSNHCLANAVEPLRAANMLSRKPLYRWHYLGIDGDPLLSSSGLPVQPEARLEAHPGGDCLLVMPSYGFEAYVTASTRRALRAAAERFETLIGLDTGSWLLASAGLLDGRRATIHWDEITRFAEIFPEVDVVEDRFVIDGDRLSCGGVTTTFELMLELIGRHHGPLLKLNVAALFMHGERDPRLDPSLRLPPDRVVQAAVAIMRRHVEQPLSIGQVAERLGMGQRALALHFKKAAGRTPQRVYSWIRLGEVLRLVEQTNLGIAEIASRTGYQDASAMTRAFKAHFGHPPSAIRADRR